MNIRLYLRQFAVLLAEYFYTRNKKIFYTIIFYRLLILIINTLIPLLLWDKVYHLSFLDYAVRYDIHYFKEEYLLTYQLYFLYAAVHINAIVYTAKKQFVPLYIIFLISLMVFLAVASTIGRIPVENYPQGFLDDATIRSWFHSCAVIYVLFLYIFASGRAGKMPDPKEFSILLLYLIYNLMMIAENVFDDNYFRTYTYTYPFILLLVYIVLKSNQQKLIRIYLDNRIKYFVISFCAVMVYMEDFLVYKIMWVIIGSAFYFSDFIQIE